MPLSITATLEPVQGLAALRKCLGDIAPSRIVMDPPPGSATFDDLLRLTQQTGRLVEWVDGTLVEKPMGYEESQLANQIGRYLANHVDPPRLGDVLTADGALRLAEDLVRVPDVCFISRRRRPLSGERVEKIPLLAPDIAVEILSESNTKKEMARKRDEYFKAGTQLVWEVDPDRRTVTVYTAPDASQTLTAAETLDGGAVLPEFSLPLRKLFAVLGPS